MAQDWKTAHPETSLISYTGILEFLRKNTKFTSEKLSALLNTNTSNFRTTKKISIRISISLNKIFRNFYLNLKLNKVLHRRRLREQHAGMKNSVSNGLANFGNFPHLGGYPFAHHWAAKHAAASPAEYNLSFGLAKYQFWLHNFLEFLDCKRLIRSTMVQQASKNY